MYIRRLIGINSLAFFLREVADAWEKARRKILEVVNDLLRTLLTLHFKIIKILKLTLICSLLFFGEIYIPPSISAFFHYPEEQEGSERGSRGPLREPCQLK